MSPRDGFDLWLESELRRRLHGVTAAPLPRPRYRDVDRTGRRRLRLVSGAGAAVAAKAATGLLVTAFAVGATGAALTGSPNPTTWSASVHQVVDQCKAGASVEGIGGCVAAVSQERPLPVAAGTPDNHPPAPAVEPSHAAGVAATGKPTDHPVAAASAEATETPKSPTTKPEHSPKPSPSAAAGHSPAPSPEPRDGGEHGQHD